MDLQQSLKQAWEICLLKEPTMAAVAKDSQALKPALIIVAGVGLLGAIGSYIFPSTVGMVTYRYDLIDLVVQAAISVAVGIGLLYITGYLAERVFHSKLDMESYVKVAGHASLVNAVSFIPMLSGIAGLWSLVILVVILHKIGKMQAGSIILLILLEALVIFVLAGLLLGSMMGLGMRGMMF